MNEKLLLLILRLSCLFLFAGRAWQHLVWDAPYRVFFWDETLLKPLVEGVFHIPWDTYVTSPAIDHSIRLLVRLTGCLYALCALLSLAPRTILRKGRPLLLLAATSLTALALLYSKDKFFELGMFIEYACQFMAPLFLCLAIGKEGFSSRLILGMKLAIAMTFLGHGLYAASYYPVPGNFIDMTINCLGVSQPVAVKLLFAAGIIDFLIAALIFVPGIDAYFLGYAIAWGLLTSLARTVSYFDGRFVLSSLNQWLPETIMRMPHAGIPLCVFLAVDGSAAFQRCLRLKSRIKDAWARHASSTESA